MLKLLSRGLASAVLMTGLFAASQASAATICSNCLYGNTNAVYLGVHDSATFDGSGFRREGLATAVPLNDITDTWIFDLQPQGASTQVNANFVPLSPLYVTDFRIAIYEVSSFVYGPGAGHSGIGNSTGTSGLVDTVTLGLLKGNSVSVVGGANLFPVDLAAGTYAFVVTYDLSGPPPGGETSEYSGQLRTRPLPEPASLALVGLALLGAATASIRSRKA